MIRERVDIRGLIRPMESIEDTEALKLLPSQIGLLREGPLNKWLRGQDQYDRKFHRAGKRALKKRIRYQVKAEAMLNSARDQGLELVNEVVRPSAGRHMSMMSVSSSSARIDDDRRWGPLDLDDEPNAPPSAIAKRRDTVSYVCCLRFQF